MTTNQKTWLSSDLKKKINPRKQPGKITIVKVEWRQIAITIQAVMRILQVRNDELKPDLSYRQY
jgi:hypothetical protein